MHEEESTKSDRLKTEFTKIVGNHKVQLIATAVVTAVLTRKLTLIGVFTYPQMDQILSDEYLTAALLASAHKRVNK